MPKINRPAPKVNTTQPTTTNTDCSSTSLNSNIKKINYFNNDFNNYKKLSRLKSDNAYYQIKPETISTNTNKTSNHDITITEIAKNINTELDNHSIPIKITKTFFLKIYNYDTFNISFIALLLQVSSINNDEKISQIVKYIKNMYNISCNLLDISIVISGIGIHINKALILFADKNLYSCINSITNPYGILTTKMANNIIKFLYSKSSDKPNPDPYMDNLINLQKQVTNIYNKIISINSSLNHIKEEKGLLARKSCSSLLTELQKLPIKNFMNKILNDCANLSGRLTVIYNTLINDGELQLPHTVVDLSTSDNISSNSFLTDSSDNIQFYTPIPNEHNTFKNLPYIVEKENNITNDYSNKTTGKRPNTPTISDTNKRSRNSQNVDISTRINNINTDVDVTYLEKTNLNSDELNFNDVPAELELDNSNEDFTAIFGELGNLSDELLSNQ